jgi:hypothetical protein
MEAVVTAIERDGSIVFPVDVASIAVPNPSVAGAYQELHDTIAHGLPPAPSRFAAPPKPQAAELITAAKRRHATRSAGEEATTREATQAATGKGPSAKS